MVEANQSKSSQSGLRPQVAQKRIESFGRHFGTSHLYFAQHAAFPLALTPDIYTVSGQTSSKT